MFDEKYVVSVMHPDVKIERYFVDNITELEKQDYEFLFKANTNFEKMNNLNTKKIFLSTYNLGKFVHEKFTFQSQIEIPEETSHKFINKEINRNIFLTALYETNLEYQGRMKEIYTKSKEKIHIGVNDSITDEKNRVLFFKELRKAQREIYLRKVEGQFKLNNITQKDNEKLLKLLNNWVKCCGLSKFELNASKNKTNLFSIILLAHKVYLFIKNDISDLEVNIIYSITRKGSNCETNISVETINDLIYFLVMNYFKFDGYGYVFCEQCGSIVEGNKKKKTCSERCKKARQRKTKRNL